MRIFLEKAVFVNRAPFERLELDFSENEIGVLTAVNGRGKTTIISHIVDAFYEMVKPYFPNEFEDKQNKFYRVSTAIYNIDQTASSFVYLRFRTPDETIDYIDIRNNCTELQYNEAITIEDKIPFNELQHDLSDNYCVKKVSANFNKEKLKKIFDNNIMTYFPAYRYEQPGYLTDPYKVKLDFKISSDFSGYLRNPIEVVSGLQQIASWMMDIVLDMQYTSSEVNMLKENLDNIISLALSSKNSGKFRIGIGPRGFGSTRIQIVNSDIERSIYPSIFNLSSGELTLICIFCELLKQADKNKNNIRLEEISGIVLIDEVDKHLHIKLQKEVLPILFNLFPNVQFIISSHSPFLNIGLAESALERTRIIDLDSFGISKDPTSNILYTEVYNMMVSENDRFKEMYSSLKEKILEDTKPLIITEGKTDIKHIKKAKEKLEINDFDLEFIEPENQPDGYSNLQTLLDKVSKIKHNRIVIGIFDRDRDDITKDIEKNNQPFKEYKNGVYAFCISSPEYRKQQGQDKISIEFLYSNDEITTKLENNCRLFFGTEFNRSSMRHNSEDLTLNKPDGKGQDKIIENNGGQAVYDFEDNNVLAKKDDFANAIIDEKINVSKESWENFRHIFDKIRFILDKENDN